MPIWGLIKPPPRVLQTQCWHRADVAWLAVNPTHPYNKLDQQSPSSGQADLGSRSTRTRAPELSETCGGLPLSPGSLSRKRARALEFVSQKPSTGCDIYLGFVFVSPGLSVSTFIKMGRQYMLFLERKAKQECRYVDMLILIHTRTSVHTHTHTTQKRWEGGTPWTEDNLNKDDL